MLAIGALLACQKPTELVDPVGTNPADSLGTATGVGQLIGTPLTKTISPAGSTLTTPDGKITLQFPAGAVSKETTITLQAGENKAPNGVGASVSISPAGITFQQPVTMTYTYQEPELNGASVDAIGVAYQDQHQAWQLTHSATIDKSKKTVTTRLSKSAWWSLITQYKLTPEQTTVNVNEALELKLIRVGGTDAVFTGVDRPVPLVSTDASKDVAKLYINGEDWTSTKLKDARYGSIAQNRQTGLMLYQAPPEKPDPNPVMVGVELKNPTSKAVFTLFSSVTISKEDYLTINGKSFDNKLSVLGAMVNGQVVLSAIGSSQSGKDGSLQVTIDNLSVGAHSFTPDYQHGTTIQAMDYAGTGDYINGFSFYDKCRETLTEPGSVNVLSAERVNGSVKLVVKVSGSVVSSHDSDFTDGGCVVTKHKTMPVQAGFTVFIKQ